MDPDPKVLRLPDERDRHLYQVYRSQIEFESDLIGQRLSWLLAAEAFLFVGYVTALGLHHSGNYERSVQWAVYLLPALGISLAALTIVAVTAAVHRIAELRRYFERFAGNADEPEPYPSIISKPEFHRAALWQVHLTAPLIIAVWVAFLISMLLPA